MSSNTKVILSVCILLAISGTTPPYNAWVFIWVKIVVATSSVPFLIIDILVSSQEDSMANIYTSFIFNSFP